MSPGHNINILTLVKKCFCILFILASYTIIKAKAFSCKCNKAEFLAN